MVANLLCVSDFVPRFISLRCIHSRFMNLRITNRSIGIRGFRDGYLRIPSSIFAVLVSLTTAGCTEAATADSAVQPDVLMVKPNKCISLRQGLICYQRVRFEWSLDEVGDYCLIEEAAQSPLTCWSQLRSGSYVTEFASRENRNYFLINKTDRQRVGNATLQVAWVYRTKQRSRGRWRLF